MKLFSRIVWRGGRAHRVARKLNPYSKRSFSAMAGAALFALGASLHAVPAHAVTLDDALACNDHAHAYIQSLQDQHLIGDHAMHVEDDGLNVFAPTHEAKLTAFNLRVFFVLGYQQDDPMFKPGKGEPMGGGLYGVVVNAETAAVAKAVTAAGSPAEYKHAGPFLTALYCRAH